MTGTIRTMAKTKPHDQVLAMKEKAVRFVRDVLDDDERADEIQDETPEEYAERKGIQIAANPSDSRLHLERRAPMPTKEELEDRIAELEEENQTLHDKLDSILDIAESDGEEPEEELAGAEEDEGQVGETDVDEDEYDSDGEDPEELSRIAYLTAKCTRDSS